VKCAQEGWMELLKVAVRLVSGGSGCVKCVEGSRVNCVQGSSGCVNCVQGGLNDITQGGCVQCVQGSCVKCAQEAVCS
jgi:hypothetical protein